MDPKCPEIGPGNEINMFNIQIYTSGVLYGRIFKNRPQMMAPGQASASHRIIQSILWQVIFWCLIFVQHHVVQE